MSLFSNSLLVQSFLNSNPAAKRQRRERLRLRQMIIERFEQRLQMAADLEPIKIVNPGTRDSSPEKFVQVGSQLFFTATTETGSELWKTDGTVAGTVQVKDILPGPLSSSPSFLTAVGTTLYFKARNNASGEELWKSDGTAAGTVMVKDILPGTLTSGVNSLCDVSGTLYFSANDGASGTELWKSDGTAAGTVMVKNIRVGANGSGVNNIVNLAGSVIFAANDGSSGYELWKSDGTSVGTVQVTSINPGAASAFPNGLTVVNNAVFFAASDGINGTELWRTGGSAATTLMVRNIVAGGGSSYPSRLLNANGVLYFTATDAATGSELWKSDGSLAGTAIVRDINLGIDSGAPDRLTNVGSTVYFSATDNTTGRELWKSDGSLVGTVLVKDIRPGTLSSYINEMIPLSGSIIFAAYDAEGSSLWKSDGTNVGTVPLKHTQPTSLGFQAITPAIAFQGAVYFTANDGASGIELWKTNGSSIGTALFKDINNNYAGTAPTKLDVINGKVFYTAVTETWGRELWVSDGTAPGTQMVLDINPGTASAAISNANNVSGVLYFRANDGTHGYELWRSDGTAAGTFLVKDMAVGVGDSYPGALTNVSGNLFFTVTTGGSGRELWISDGTDSGTRLVKDINPGSTSGSPSGLVNANGTLLFSANGSAATGVELWTSDGTAINTNLVKDIRAGGSSSPAALTYFDGKVYFRANDGASGIELWASDGTTSGTILLADIAAGAASSYPNNFVAIGNKLYFSAGDANGVELWKTDGTPLGTAMVKDIAAGAGNSTPSNLFSFNGELYFTASDSLTGSELWKSDGTLAGTVLVKDILPGTSNSNVSSLVNLNGRLAFLADDGSGARVWTSDGSTVGTTPLITTPGTPAPVNALVNLNGHLVGTGFELLQTTQNVTVDLSTSTTDRAIVIRKSNSGIEVFDQTNSAQLAFLSSAALIDVQQLTITGSASANETVTIDYLSGGFFRLPEGITINAGSSAGDSLTIVGNLPQQLGWQSLNTSQSAAFSVQLPGSTSTGNIDGFESITTTGFIATAVTSLLQAGPPNFFFNNPGILNLGQTTQVGGGTLNTTSLASLGAGEFLTGSGSVLGRFNAEIGSLIMPTGNMSIGSSASTSGFNSRGDLIVDQYSVSLLDANEAVLGSQTTLGNGAIPGTLTASNGLLADFGNNISGFGSINTPNLSSKPLTMNGSIIGNSVANPITLTGYVKGVGSLTNVNIAGTYSPGFSPAAVTVGTMSYAATATTIIEIGGPTAGTGYDQINHVGTASLGGALNVQFINSYVPAVGDTFTIMTATDGFTGSFASQDLPTPPLGSGWHMDVSTKTLKLQLVDLANVVSTQFGDGTVQRSSIGSLVVTFEGQVDIDADAFSVLKRGVGGGLVTNSFVTSVNGSGNTVATISFSGSFTRSTGPLVDGYYQLTIDNSKVRRAGTLLRLDGDNDGVPGGNFVRGTSATDNYFAYFGDSNGDGTVGVAEFGQFRSTFGKLPSDPGYNALFDFDGGGVGVSDFGQFRARFGRAVVFE